MTTKRTLFTITALCIAIFIAGFIAVGCTSTPSSTNTTEVTDTAGRCVQVPNKVSKIAIVGSSARIATYAGCADKIVAVTDMDKADVARPYTIANKSIFENLPSTNNGNHLNSTTVDEERMLQIKPDIILSSRNAEECEALQQNTGLPVVCVYASDDLFGQSIKNAITVCGEAAGTSEHAQNTIDFMEKCQRELTELSAGLSLPKLYRGAINYKGTKGFTGTISNYSVYKYIGAINVADRDDISNGYDTTFEQILS